MPARWIVATAAVVATFASTAATASASTIVYQCDKAVCAVDPDAGGKPRQLTAEGRLAGITRDGATVSWIQPSGEIVQAPAAGGAPRVIPYDGAVVNQPSMSPDGTRYMWWYPGPDPFGGFNAVWVNRLTVGQPETDGVSFCHGCTTSHGWIGANQSIAAFPGDAIARNAPSTVCVVASKEEAPNVSRSCVQQLVSDTRGGIGFPNGNAAGTELVAVLTPGELTGVYGRIVRYSLANGALIGDVTQGTTDTAPVFSPEGDRIAFQRDEQIVVKDLASGAERVLGPGVYPHWGGARSLPISVARTLGVSALRKGRASARVGCAAACRVSASLQVSGGTARRLGLGRKSTTVASASASRKSAGTAKLRLRATRKAAGKLSRLRSYAATLRVSVKPPDGAAVKATQGVRVKR